MLKRAVQQGPNERSGESYASVRWVSERCENVAGGRLEHPVKHAILPMAGKSVQRVSFTQTRASIGDLGIE